MRREYVQAPPLARLQRREEPGPLDWLVPFIPPVLRVNRETRAALRRQLKAALTVEAVVAAARSAADMLRTHWRTITRYAVVSVLWLRVLYWINQNAGEFTAAFVILSGFAALGVHLLAPGADAAGDGLSAYSVFNRGGQRMLGSLSAEQFENEIRHRGPQHETMDDDRALNQRSESEGEEVDEEMLLALKLSVQEKKREERRMRRTTRRR